MRRHWLIHGDPVVKAVRAVATDDVGASILTKLPTALRAAKNYTKGYTDTQSKVREATSNDAWGPSGTQMNEIAQLTYNQNDFVEVMETMDKRLNDKGKNWRHVFKALTLLDYCLHAGSENVVIYFKDNIYIVKTLKEFVYVDEAGKDVGANVRQKAKDITNLLQDEDRLRNERRSRGDMRDRMLGNLAESGLRGEGDYGGPRPEPSRRDPNPAHDTIRRPRRSGDEDDDLQKAIAESMRMQEEEAARRSQVTKEEDDFQRALRLSKEEEEKRKREQEEANAKALFDDDLNLNSNNQYAQQPQQDLFAPMGGYPLVDIGYGQQQQLQPQYTSFNPFHAQMMAQQQQMQQEEFMRQQMAMQEQQRQQEEYMRQQMMQQQQQSLFAQPTGYGSNNPFAPGVQQHSSPQQQSQSFSPPRSSFLPVPTVTQSPSPTPQPQAQLQPQSPPKTFNPPKPANDGQHAHLANLLARGREDGMDTFGNVGNLQLPRLTMPGFGTHNPFGRPQQQQGSSQQQNGRSDQPFFSV
ncbi:hypothetical protein BD324DRAFT_577472 [Kockovaella imperatae]|uniref:ENTH domain-containing protein n=1 Tax=Kockovaella imperatae TaxID=4999 RepID=A0A1Y1UMX8_9TREE|nr:hypothetical protein BD324DRAFT_577472 [Kockovaella imperatae]ORX38485.1 hypothetical protein BD324DRAFT_577472 [Kockovaella imperatae]